MHRFRTSEEVCLQKCRECHALDHSQGEFESTDNGRETNGSKLGVQVNSCPRSKLPLVRAPVWQRRVTTKIGCSSYPRRAYLLLPQAEMTLSAG
jgi:hypothetical protein